MKEFETKHRFLWHILGDAIIFLYATSLNLYQAKTWVLLVLIVGGWSWITNIWKPISSKEKE